MRLKKVATRVFINNIIKLVQKILICLYLAEAVSQFHLDEKFDTFSLQEFGYYC